MKKDVAYQNKDVCSKVLTSWFGHDVFDSFNVNVPEIKDTRPTNLPEIHANELRLDCLFELTDGSRAIVDYESAYKKKNWIKYGEYVMRLLEELRTETGSLDHMIRIIILYTGNVKRTSVPTQFNVGAVQISIEPGFLSEIPRKMVRRQIKAKIKADIKLTDSEMIRFMILPLTYEGKKKQQKVLREMIELARTMQDEEVSKVLISGLLVFGDKIIGDDMARNIRRWLAMTKVERLIVEEQEDVLNKVIQEKDQAVQEKDQAVQEKDQAVQEKDQAVQEKDQAVQEKNYAIQEKVQAVQEKAKAIHEKEESILNGLRGIIKTFRVSPQEAMNCMGIALQDRDRYLSMLKI